MTETGNNKEEDVASSTNAAFKIKSEESISLMKLSETESTKNQDKTKANSGKSFPSNTDVKRYDVLTKSTDNWEEILAEINPCGRFQILLCFIISLSDAASSWGMLIMILAGATPDWTCEGNTSSTTNDSWQYCPSDGRLCPNLTFNNDFTSVVSEWNLICGQQWVVGIVTTVQMAGVMLGVVLSGVVGDLLGRKINFFLFYVLLMVTNLITAFSVSVEMYAAMRFFVGVGTGGILVGGIVIPVEYLGMKYRTFSKILPMAPIGTMFIALLAYFLPNWRHLAIAISCVGTPYLLFWWFVPENPRWLMTRGRYDEAATILKRIAKFNKRPEPDLSKLMVVTKLLRQNQKEAKKYTYLDIFRTWTYAKKTLLFFFIWFTVAMVWNSLSFGVKNWQGDRYINLVINSAADVPAYLALVLNYKIGRRYSTLILLSVSGTMSLVICVVDWTGVTTGDIVSGCAFTAKLAIYGSWMVLKIFTVEHYPTVVRNIALGWCNVGAQVAAMIAPLTIELHTYSGSIPYAVNAGLILFSLLCICLLAETKGQDMMDYLPPTNKKNTKSSTESELTVS